jgi:hypothetical protein
MNVTFCIIITIAIIVNNVVDSAYVGKRKKLFTLINSAKLSILHFKKCVESIDEANKMNPSEGLSSNYIFRRGLTLRNGHVGASLNMPYYRLCYLRGPIAALFKSGFQWLQKSQDPTGKESSLYPVCHPRFMFKVNIIYILVSKSLV